MRRIRVWDLPLRLFHWALVLAVIAAFVAVNAGEMDWHGRAGLTVLGLVVFRVVWGFTGSTHARFRDFVRGPRAIREYLRGNWHGQGHNPLGALSVLALLALLGAQAVTGLFANDDATFSGPLAGLVSGDTGDLLTSLHHLQALLIMLLVLLHLGAIGWYARVKKQDLIRPMITGQRDVDDADPENAGASDAGGGGWLALVIAVAIALAAVYVASGAWIPPPPPVQAPAW
ncbi:MAG: cytochrome b/b6 domain-containing protein [Gammaproteobacteria bacterium]